MLDKKWILSNIKKNSLQLLKLSNVGNLKEKKEKITEDQVQTVFKTLTIIITFYVCISITMSRERESV